MITIFATAAAEARPYSLLWDANTDAMTRGYYVYYGTASGTYQPVQGIDVGNVTEFQVDLNPGQTYYFKVNAYDQNRAFGPDSDEMVFVVPGNPSVQLSSASVAPGATITATVANGPGNALDYVGFFPTGSSVTGWTDWKYLNGSRTAPSTGRTGASVSFVAPSTPGTYNVRFYSSGTTPVLLAQSVAITVAIPPPAASVSASPSSVTSGQTINVSVANGPARASDYVGLYVVGASSYTDFRYLNGSQTAPSNGTATANLSFTAPTAAGQYNVRFVSNGSVIATSSTISVAAQPAAPASVTVNTPSVSPGGTIGFTVANGPGNRMDWVVLVPAGASDSSYQQWMYLNGTKTAPSSGLTGATLQFPAPSVPGSYNIRLFANNSLNNKLATSNAITVASQPTLTINDVTVTEGNSGTTNATFTVTLTPPNNSQTVTVAYATGDTTATAGSDYSQASGTLTFAAGDTTATITVNVIGDTAAESNEQFVVNLSNAVNAVIGDAQGTATITNDDNSVASGPTVTMMTPNVPPGGTVRVAVSGGPANALDWVALVPANSADNGYVDWFYLNGSKSQPSSGVASATIQFSAPAATGNYNVRLFANNVLSKLATSSNVMDSNGPAISISDPVVSEGNSGATIMTFTVSVSPANTSNSVTVNYATANGTASSSSDYVSTSGTLTFNPSVTTQTISVTVNGDTTIEGNETLFVNLSNAAGASLADAQGMGTIVNDDVPPGPSVIVSQTTVAAGGLITVSIAGGPANLMDWVTVVPAAGADNAYMDWVYLGGAKSVPASGRSSATVQLRAPATPGTYNVRFFANNVLQKLGTSATITVQ